MTVWITAAGLAALSLAGVWITVPSAERITKAEYTGRHRAVDPRWAR